VLEIAFVALFVANVALIVRRTPQLGQTAAHDTGTEEGQEHG
jgi:uncharacterized membrane protein YhaH (DUF805 family)